MKSQLRRKVSKARKVNPRRMDFLKFSRLYKEQLLGYATMTAAAIPNEMYGNDHKFDIGKLTAQSFDNRFNCIAWDDKSPVGYDLFYEDSGELDEFSLKFNKTNPFQVVKSDCSLSTPKSIIIKNSMSNDTDKPFTKEDLHFDYLFTVGYKVRDPKDSDQYRLFFKELDEDKVEVTVAYGVATKDTVFKHIIEKSIGTPQILAKLNNDDWDYFSGHRRTPVDVDRELLNVIYQEYQTRTWNALLNSVKEEI